MLVVALTWRLAAAETPATVTCKDGTSAPGGRGACHGHGGVDKTKTAAEAASAPTGAAKSAAAATTVTCKDGTTAPGGRGACRGHGGVDKTKSAGGAAAVPAAPAAPPAAAAAPEKIAAHGKAATSDPSGAIARCKDGAYWHGKVHSGACSHHGGVADWLDGSQK